MKNKQLRSVGILGTGSYLPENIVTNADLEKIMDTTDEWITGRTGIKERRIADEYTATSDLSTEAAKIALKDAGVTAEELDLIIIATITPDLPFPATACIVQAKLGAVNAAAFDLSAACSGFVYNIELANSLIASGVYEKILIIGAETLSKIINWDDRKTAVIFADGAGAAVLGTVPEGEGILATLSGADGKGVKFLKMDAGGSRMPASIETVKQNLHTIQMDGSEVFKFASRKMKEISIEVIEKSGYKIEDLDYMVPHQANIRIISNAAKKLNLSMDKVYINLDKYGNMSAASVPVALDEAAKQKKFKKGDLVLVVSFGGGLTWSAALIKWSKD